MGEGHDCLVYGSWEVEQGNSTREKRALPLSTQINPDKCSTKFLGSFQTNPVDKVNLMVTVHNLDILKAILDKNYIAALSLN